MIDSEKSEGRVTNMFCVKLEVKKHAQNLIWTLAVGERDTGVRGTGRLPTDPQPWPSINSMQTFILCVHMATSRYDHLCMYMSCHLYLIT